MKGVKLDDNIFTSKDKANEAQSSQKQGKKQKKNRGEDFLDYANKNGIQLNLEYEDKANTRMEKKGSNYQSSKPKGKFQGEKEGKGQGGKPSYQEGGKKYKGYSGGYSSYKKPYHGPKRSHFKTGNNKFDLCNMHLPKMMHMMQPIYNPFSGMMPQYMPQMVPGYFNQPLNHLALPELHDNSDKSISDFLEIYLSLDNLNQDLYLRNRIDENGFIEASEIANHNKLRNKVTVDKLMTIFKDNTNPVVEAQVTEEGLLLRNRDFDNIKDKLLTFDQIQQQRKMQKAQQYMNANPMNTLNYVSMQNNYFFNSVHSMPHQDPMAGMSGMHMGYQPQMMNTTEQTADTNTQTQKDA